ncbi:MAG TPA: protein translocase subunit SecD [Candidatus Paceibacterota bacterium]|nr:protein translocase subunit SecD [Candidatus Paceibacterota bacterium]
MHNRKRLVFFLVILVIVSAFSAIFVYEPLWQKWSSFRPWRLGLDLAGGTYLVYEVDLSAVAQGDRDSVVKGLRDTIEKRVNLFGVSEPKVYLESGADSNRLIVELAGVKDVTSAINEIGATPFLDFREVVEKSETVDGEATTTLSVVPTELTGRYVKGAQVGFDSYTGEPQVYLQFTDEGAKIFEEVTARNIGKPLCIFLDNQIRSFEEDCPTVQAKISGGNAQITGRFTTDEVKKIVERFNAGALPAPIKLVNQQTISSDFGADSLNKAIFAGALGTGIVALFMLVFYRRLGVFAVAALAMYVALTLAVFKIVPVTMTLAGIAGFILSIGMAVDANILVFERTKEELKKGLSRTAAIEEGFRRAWTSIRDSNVSTMITSAVLYYFTSSFVRGFALALFLGVVVSMFSAITITRVLLRVFVRDVQRT